MTDTDSIKICGSCKTGKRINEFPADKKRKDGRHPYCRECNNARTRAIYARDRADRSAAARSRYRAERVAYLEKAKNWAKENPEKRREISRNYVKANPEKRAETSRNNRLQNPGMYAAHYKARQQRKRKAMPVWANEESIKAIYRQCAFVTRITGIKHHVDHYYPLKNDLVCGLHNEYNLRIIPAAVNLSKGNRLLP